MTAVLHAIPASHPCAAVERALQLKELPYRRVENIPVAAQARRAGALRRRDGAGARVPGRRRLARLARDPARARGRTRPSLLPADPEAGARVERAEEWGDQVLQPLVRRVVWAARRGAGRATMMRYGERASCRCRAPFARLSAPLVARVARAVNGGTDLNVRADLPASPTPRPHRRLDRRRRAGRRGAERRPICRSAPSLALLPTVEDLAGCSATARRARSRGAGSPTIRVACPPGRCPPAWLGDEASSASWAPWATGPQRDRRRRDDALPVARRRRDSIRTRRGARGRTRRARPLSRGSPRGADAPGRTLTAADARRERAARPSSRAW